MKKTALITALVLAVALAQSAWATITFIATPASQTVAQGGTFNVTFALTVTQGSNPGQVFGTDLFINALKSQNSVSDISNLFAISGYTSLVTGGVETGVSSFPDTLTAAKNTNHGTTTVENTTDSGTTFNSPITTPISNLQFETLTFSVAPGTPLGTYTFGTTTPNNTSDARGSHISGDNGYNIPTTQASFSITVVPEPATLSLMAMGGLSSLGLMLIRARRRKS
jgi:hypothetical protein